MNKTLEKKIVAKIQSAFGKILQEYDYKHTKPSFYIKKEGDWYLVIHLHKFSFAPAFRIHTALRHINDSFEAIALNGPDSDVPKKYRIVFSDDLESLNKCVGEMMKFVHEVSFEWFKEMSVMVDEEKVRKLKITLSDSSTVKQQTNKLLGVKI